MLNLHASDRLDFPTETKKWELRSFLKHGETPGEAWEEGDVITTYDSLTFKICHESKKALNYLFMDPITILIEEILHQWIIDFGETEQDLT